MFYTAYSVSLIQKSADTPPKTQFLPLASIHEDKFRITYENGDYEELDHHESYKRAKAWMRTNLGCKFDGDVNPATGNRVRDVYSDSPCNAMMFYERHPFQHPNLNGQQ